MALSPAQEMSLFLVLAPDAEVGSGQRNGGHVG